MLWLYVNKNFKRFGNPNWKLLGIDFSTASLEQLKRREIQGILSRFEEIKWTREPAGVIIMNQIIEHFEDPGTVLEKAFDILRPGGVVIMETPSLEGWDAHLFRDRYWGGWHAPRHWTLYTEDSLKEVVQKSGFEVAEINYILSPFTWLHSLQYLIRERFNLPRFSRVFDVDNFLGLCVAGIVDSIQLAIRSKTANMRFIARKPID